MLPLDPLEQPAIPQSDCKLLERYHDALDSLKMDVCTNCNEKWFDMDIKEDGICH
jgi:hypothetical protein